MLTYCLVWCLTGRAGNKGTAITFIAPEDDRYAPDLVKALKESGAPVPQDLQVRPCLLAHSLALSCH